MICAVSRPACCRATWTALLPSGRPAGSPYSSSRLSLDRTWHAMNRCWEAWDAQPNFQTQLTPSSIAPIRVVLQPAFSYDTASAIYAAYARSRTAWLTGGCHAMLHLRACSQDNDLLALHTLKMAHHVGAVIRAQRPTDETAVPVTLPSAQTFSSNLQFKFSQDSGVLLIEDTSRQR